LGDTGVVSYNVLRPDNYLLIPMAMRILSQRDPVWAGENIGKTNIKIGRYGCTITCLSMLSDYFGCFKTPAWMGDNLRFTNQALLYWQSVSERLCFNFARRYYGVNYPVIDEALKNPKKAVILEVEHYHWVLAIGKIPFTKIYRIADPWTGTKRLSTAYRYISGFTTFEKN